MRHAARHAARLAALAALPLAACGPDLPEGWEDAEPIDDFVQRACEGDPYAGTPATVTAQAADGAVDVVYDKAHFRCAQDVEGFYRADGAAVSVLVQPVDMDPEMVAKCDCLYTIEMGIPVAAETVTVFRRWDNINDPNDPVEEGTATVE